MSEPAHTVLQHWNPELEEKHKLVNTYVDLSTQGFTTETLLKLMNHIIKSVSECWESGFKAVNDKSGISCCLVPTTKVVILVS